MTDTANRQAQHRAALRMALILGAVALGLFIFTLVRGFK